MDQFILNSNSGARVWKQNQKAQWLWSFLSKWISNNWRGTVPHPWWLEWISLRLRNGGVQYPHPKAWGQITLWGGGEGKMKRATIVSPCMLLIAPVGTWAWVFSRGLDLSSAKASTPESCWLSSYLSMLTVIAPKWLFPGAGKISSNRLINLGLLTYGHAHFKTWNDDGLLKDRHSVHRYSILIFIPFP